MYHNRCIFLFLSDLVFSLTLIMLNHVTDTRKSDSWGDVITPIVQTSQSGEETTLFTFKKKR